MHHESVERVPCGRLAAYVARLHGYRFEGFPAGVHVGMPSRSLTLVIGLDRPLEISGEGIGGRLRGSVLVGGLHDRPVGVHHDGAQHGIQLALTPAGARALLGCPARELAARVLRLDEVVGRAADELLERTLAATSWPARLAVVEMVLATLLTDAGAARSEVGHAWDELDRADGGVTVAELARRVGWSRRHLAEQFRSEFGYGPKTAARVMRFERSQHLIRQAPRRIAEAAAQCGYADQAHLTREWSALAGLPPRRWMAEDSLANVQYGVATFARA